MTGEYFNQAVETILGRCTDVLCKKAEEYATADRLHNFKQAAHIQKTTPVKALGGMMAKHTVSVYDMIESGKAYPASLWNEKIIDSINYLLLLRTLVDDEDLATMQEEEVVIYADGKPYITASH